MAYELITDWTGYREAVEQLLGMARQEILIYDEDILALNLGTLSHIEMLQSVLKTGQRNALRIAVRNGENLTHHAPRLAQLLQMYSHIGAAQQTPEHLAHLRDSMLLVDGIHALIRFDRDHPRSKLLIDEKEALQPYRRRFDEIWAEGGDPLGNTTPGL